MSIFSQMISWQEYDGSQEAQRNDVYPWHAQPVITVRIAMQLTLANAGIPEAAAVPATCQGAPAKVHL